MSDDIDANIDSQVEEAMKILGDVEEPTEPDNSPIEDELGAEELTEDKPNEEEVVEPETALEPPASWRSDEKELFKNLPREAQETAIRLQQAQDSHFTQRSTELAQARRSADDERQQYQAERTRIVEQRAQLEEIACQLLPAQFSDIKNEADYLKLKMSDPERAAQFDVFQRVLADSRQENAKMLQSQLNEQLNREWGTLVEKYPEYQDTAKAKTMMDGVRKGAVEYYGYTPQETQIIPDHRQILVMKDALAWREYQANLKAVGLKKSIPMQKRVLKPRSSNGAVDNKSALLNRARKTDRIYDKVDAITAYLNQVG